MESWVELEKAVDDGLIKSIGKQRRRIVYQWISCIVTILKVNFLY